MKLCTRCNVTKAYKDFYKQAVNSKDGYQSHCKVCDNARKKDWNDRNQEKCKAYAKQAEANRKLDEKRIQYRKELKKLPHVKASRNANYAKRRAAKMCRTPKWLSVQDLEVIKAFYSVAQMLTRVNKEEWHVDHDIPLQGKLVSGLHVPANLRLLRGIDNETKRNHYEIT